MKVHQLLLSLQRVPTDAEILADVAGELFPVVSVGLSLSATSFEIDPKLTWQEQAGSLVRLVLKVEEPPPTPAPIGARKAGA